MLCVCFNQGRCSVCLMCAMSGEELFCSFDISWPPIVPVCFLDVFKVLKVLVIFFDESLYLQHHLVSTVQVFVASAKCAMQYFPRRRSASLVIFIPNIFFPSDNLQPWNALRQLFYLFPH